MKSYRNPGIVLLTGVLLLAGLTGNAWALTDACISIENQATLSYAVDSVDQEDILSDDPNDTTGSTDKTIFSVGTKVDLTVAFTSSVASGVPGDTGKVITYSITNTGNDQQRYRLRLWAGQTGTANIGGTDYTDAFDVTGVQVYSDTNSSFASALDDGEVPVDDSDAATDGTPLGYTPVVDPGDTIYVHVVASIPLTATNGQDALYALQAVTHQPTGLNGDDGSGSQVDGGETTEVGTVTENGCGNEIVLADDDADGASGSFEAGTTDLSDAARNGDDYAIGAYTVASAAISVTKTQQTIWDPINYEGTDAKAIPGAYVRYTLTITNNGSAAAVLDKIVDDLQDDVLNFDPNLYAATGTDDADPADGPYLNGTTAGESVFIDYGGSSTRTDVYATGSTSDTDGVEYSGGTGGILTVYFTDPGSEGSVLPAVSGSYDEGELLAGESVSIIFNVIIVP